MNHFNECYPNETLIVSAKLSVKALLPNANKSPKSSVGVAKMKAKQSSVAKLILLYVNLYGYYIL